MSGTNSLTYQANPVLEAESKQGQYATIIWNLDSFVPVLLLFVVVVVVYLLSLFRENSFEFILATQGR